MKRSMKLLALVFATGSIASCATDQKTAKVEMEPLPTMIRHSDKSAGGHYSLGRYFQNTQRPDQALQAYQDALKLEPDDIKTQVVMAALYAERGDYQKSISQLKVLVEKSPDDASLYNNLGYAYLLSGNYKEANTVLGKALAIDPTNVRALNNMGSALNKLGKTDHALKFIAKAKSIKTGKIRPADSKPVSAGVEKPATEMNQLALADQSFHNQSLAEKQTVAQNQVSNEIVKEKSSQTEIRQINSGIYEIVKAETSAAAVVINTPAKEPLPEVKLLAQSGGILFKVHPMVNKLFNKNAPVIADNNELSNKMFTLEIVNGNGVKGFARKAGETLAEIGLSQPVQFANKKRYNQYKTVLEYRVGYRDEAVQLATMLDRMPALIEINTMINNSDMRLVLGRDVINPQYKQQNGAA